MVQPKRARKKPMQSTARPEGTHALFVNTPTALVAALDARVVELRKTNQFMRRLSRSDLVIEILGEAAKSWSKPGVP